MNDRCTSDMMPVADDNLMLMTVCDGLTIVIPPLANGWSVLAPVLFVEVLVNQILCESLPIASLLGLLNDLLPTNPPFTHLALPFEVRDLSSMTSPGTFDIFRISLRGTVPRCAAF